MPRTELCKAVFNRSTQHAHLFRLVSPPFPQPQTNRQIFKPIACRRILLFSSFAPFLVVFTHSIASHSQADVDLLRQVLRTLEAGRSISAATNRLYEMCKVFLRFATAFVHSRQDCFGSYNQEEDSFTFPMEAHTNNVYNLASSEFSPSGSGGFETMQENLVPMSAFLETYLGQNMNGLWNMDFS